MGSYIWYSKEGTGWGPSPPRRLLTVPNITAHPSTTSVPITVLQYNGQLLCGFNLGTPTLIEVGDSDVFSVCLFQLFVRLFVRLSAACSVTWNGCMVRVWCGQCKVRVWSVCGHGKVRVSSVCGQGVVGVWSV